MVALTGTKQDITPRNIVGKAPLAEEKENQEELFLKFNCNVVRKSHATKEKRKRTRNDGTREEASDFLLEGQKRELSPNEDHKR